MRALTNLFFICLAIILVIYISILAIGFYLSPQDAIKNTDAIVVISGGETKARTIEGVKLYQNQYAPLLIFAGAALDPASPSNASSMKEIAIAEYDIPEEDIIIEEKSTSTYENAANLKPIFDDRQIKSIILVTSPYHQRRSKMTFQQVMGSDFTIINHSSTDELWRKIAWWQNDQAIYLTTSELWKIIYIYLTGKYQ